MAHLQQLAVSVDKELKRGKYYLDSRLSIGSLSRKVGTNRSYLSQVIFFVSGYNFCGYMNHLRIEELLSGGSSVLRDENALYNAALDCGFNNRRTFYRAFLREKGVLPGDFVAQYKILTLQHEIPNIDR